MTVALVGLSALAAAGVQASTGLGFALVLTPVLFAELTPEGAIVAVTALGLTLNLLVLVAERRRPSVAWAEVCPILAAAIPGTVSGVLVLRALPKPALQVVVGVAVISAALVRVRVRATAVAAPASTPGRLVLGFATGALTTSAGVNGPPLALWLARRGLSPGEVRDSLSAIFLGSGIIGGLALIPVLPHAHLSPTLLGAALACVVAGHALGRRVFERLGDHRFEPLLLTVVLAAGLASLAAGASAL